MNTKEKVLKILYESNTSISGETIAKALGISRNSVWKSINQLKKEGYIIDSVSGNGYTLAKGNIFDEYSIKKHLKNEHKLYIYKEETSSNTVAKELCQKGEGEGSVVIVCSQTNGRGRLGRSFISSDENGLYMSIILRPKIPIEKCINITVMCAVSVLEAIEEVCSVNCTIKWVNDIYINEKKCCGILTEAGMDFENGLLHYAVVGIGVNLSSPKGGFDKEIENIACGIYEGESYPDGIKARLCAKIIDNFFDKYAKIEEKEYIKVYKEKSNIIGKEVDVYVGNKVVCGVATDIDEEANLVVTDEDGKCHRFNSGEARVRHTGVPLS